MTSLKYRVKQKIMINKVFVLNFWTRFTTQNRGNIQKEKSVYIIVKPIHSTFHSSKRKKGKQNHMIGKRFTQNL